MTWANQHLDATIISVYSILQPITTALLSFFFLDGALRWQDGLGSALILCGLITTNWESQDVDDDTEADHDSHAAGLLDESSDRAGRPPTKSA